MINRNQKIGAAISIFAGVMFSFLLLLPWADAQQKPSPVLIYCQDGSGNLAPCTSGPTAFTSADNIANQSASAIHGLSFMYDGSTWDRVRGDSTNGLLVNLGSNNDVTVSSSALPTGAATAANQDGIIKDGTGDTTQANVSDGNVHTSLQTALPAGTNNIGDVDVLTINGQAPAFGTGTRSAATQRVTIATDDVVPASQSGTWTVQPGNTANTTAWLMRTADKCTGASKTFVPISQTTSTQLFAGTASNRTYVCSIALVQPSTSTQTFSLVNGTGSVCATDTAAMIGATTAANGMQLPFAFGNGGGEIAKSTADAANVCLLQSGTDRITGVIGYVVAAN